MTNFCLGDDNDSLISDILAKILWKTKTKKSEKTRVRYNKTSAFR